MKLRNIIPLLTLSASSIVSAFQASANTNVAIYWGQNSAGGTNTQARLSEYCDNDATDIVLLSFLHIFFGTGGKPEVNFASACDDGTLFPGTALLQCPNIAQDIKTCQSKGKKVILSLGGASGSYGFSSDSQAEEFAQTLWDLFAGGNSDTRPFGDSIIDGFDLDIEGGSTVGYVAFSKKLRELYKTDSSKNYYVTAAPQCPMPDHFVNDAIAQSEIDFVFVQFYNNYCGMQAWAPNNANPNFNFDAWDSLIKSSPNPNGKIYLGVPASLSAAGSGYTGIDTVVQAANHLQSKFDSFGGIMMWDASQAWVNVNNGKNFAEGAKAGLLSGSSSNGGNDTPANQGTTSSAIKSTLVSSAATSQNQITTLSSVVKSSSAADSSSVAASSLVSSAEPTTTTFVTTIVDITSTLPGTLTITTSIPESSSSKAEIKTSTVEPSSTFVSSSKNDVSSSTLISTVSKQLVSSSPPVVETASEPTSTTNAKSQSSEVVVTVIKSSDSNLDTTSAAETTTTAETTTAAETTAESPQVTSAPASKGNDDDEDVITDVVTQKRPPSTFTIFTTRDNIVTQNLPGPAPTGNYKIIGQSAYSSLDTNGALIYNLETAPPQLDKRRAERYNGHYHTPHQKRAEVVVTTSSKTSSEATTNICPVGGGVCKTEGELKCTSHGYARCTNGHWVVHSCTAGTVCKESGSEIFCDWAGSWVLSPSSCGGYIERPAVSKRSLNENDDSIFGGGVFIAKTPDNKALTDEMYSLKISIQQLNSTHFKGMLTTSTITNNPVGKTWQLSFVSSLNIISVERGDLSYNAKNHTYTVDSIHIEEPKSNMAVLIPFWGLV